MIKYSQQEISKEDIKAVVEALNAEHITQGPLLPKFESIFAKTVSSKFCTATNSATSALHLSCKALGLKENDIVWTSPISFVASANCAIYCGANIDFVDIEPSTALMSIDLLKEKLEIAEKEGKLPKILIPVHLAGTSCDMKQIKELSDKYGFSIIEDASHAVGAKYLDEPVGSCKYSNICVFSFHPVKIITTMEGGVAVTNDKYLAEKISLLRGHGIIRDEKNFEIESPGPWYYEQQELGFNYRFNEIQAALGISQLSRLNIFLEKRHKLMSNYREGFNAYDNVNFLEEPNGTFSAYHLAIISLLKASKKQHLEIFKYMRESGIFVQLHYWPIHLNPYYQRLGFNYGDFPNAEKYGVTSFSVPLYTALDYSTQKKVIKILKEGLIKTGII